MDIEERKVTIKHVQYMYDICIIQYRHQYVVRETQCNDKYIISKDIHMDITLV